MQYFFGGVTVGAIVGVILLLIIINISNPHKRGMIAVASGQYSCELEERADKTTKWVCEGVK